MRNAYINIYRLSESVNELGEVIVEPGEVIAQNIPVIAGRPTTREIEFLGHDGMDIDYMAYVPSWVDVDEDCLVDLVFYGSDGLKSYQKAQVTRVIEWTMPLGGRSYKRLFLQFPKRLIRG